MLEYQENKNSIKNRLIYDVGMHLCEDTSYYLAKGFKVVAIDACPNYINSAKKELSKYIDKGQLILLNFAISNVDDKEVNFYVSENTDWCSLKNSIASKLTPSKEVIKVKSKKLSSLIEEYGLPYYCKIDIEGYDEICLETLSDLKEKPKFISAEVTCLDASETLSDEQARKTLDRLRDLGYTKFKLVDQYTLTVLKPEVNFYNSKDSFGFKVTERLCDLCNYRSEKYSNRKLLSYKFKYDFKVGSTGPFGGDLSYEWSDYETAKRMLSFHRKSYFSTKKSISYGFWCDWHAKL